MNENILNLLKKIKENPELVKKLSECRDPEKAFELLGGKDSGVTLEEFKETMIALSKKNELSDENLDNVSGGFSGYDQKLWDELWDHQLYVPAPLDPASAAAL